MDKPIRVLHVFGALSAGGVENFVMNVYRHIDKSKIQFDFAMTTGKKGIFDEEVPAMGGRIYYLDPTKRIEKQLRNLFRTEHFDVVHSHIFFYSGLVLREAKRVGIPIRIAHAHNANDRKLITPLRFGYEWLMQRFILCYATIMLGCSKKACDYVFGEHCFDDPRVYFFPDGIDCNRFAFSPDIREKIRRELGLEGKFVVGHVGHFSPAKNHEKVLSVFSALSRLREDCALLLVGDGELKQDIQEKAVSLGISDKIVFAGKHTDIEKYYQAMDVFLFPSRFEGFGMVMIEAQTNGLYCVASDVVPHETDATENTIHISLNASDSIWVNAICNARTRVDTAVSFQKVFEKYDISSIVGNLSEIYLGKSINWRKQSEI